MNCIKPAQKPPTRADVAKLANVSETIVSYVVNNNRYVDQEKRKRVEAAIKELNYHPNPVARALKGKRTKQILFIADQITTEHFTALIDKMDYYASEKGYLISLCKNRNTHTFVGQILSGPYDGIVLSSISFDTTYIQAFVNAGIPVVLLKNRYYDDIHGVGKIDTGLYQGARTCINHLIAQGRKNILYIDRYSKRNHFSTLEDLRYSGFVDEMHANGLEVTAEHVITGCTDSQEVIEKIKERVKQGFKVDGICGRNDKLASLGMQAMKELDYRVPEDVSIIGFDNASISQYMVPQLTTLALDREKIGQAAIEMLAQMIETSCIPEEVYIEGALVKRAST